MQLKMRRIGVAVDPPSAARSPLRETTGRDGPYSSFSCTAQGNDGKGPSLPVILPVSGGASAPKQARRGRAGQEEERRDRAFLQKRAPRGPFCGDARSQRAAPPAGPWGPRRRKRPAPGLPGAGLSTCKGKRPLLAGGVLLSHGLHRSTIGARGLNFRVRDGTGCASPAMAAGQQGAFSSAGRARPCPQGRTALESESPGPGPRPHALPAPAGGGIE